MSISTRRFFLILLPLFLPFVMIAQNSFVRGKISDANTTDALPYVNIGVKDTSIGTFSDENGLYRLELPSGEYTLVITSVGYEKTERRITLDGKKQLQLDIALRSVSQELSTVVVSASKYAQRIQESISSIEVLKPASVENSNLQTIDKAVEKVPGVTIMDNEPQIRAGSGFSSGLGSRVMVMVDEMPLLRGDAGRPVWNLMPAHEIEQIEVVKGASSVIYGSSALSGVINVRTAWPTDKNSTNISVFGGIYNKPSREYATPWSGWNPMQFGATISHSQKFKYVDVVASVSYMNDQGYIGKVPENLQPEGSTTGNYARWLKLNFNSRVRSKKHNGLTYGLNGTVMTGKSAESYFWLDSDTNIYRPYPGSLSNFEEVSFYLDPFVKYFGEKGSVHSFKNRFFYNNTHATNDQNNMSFTLYDEYQFSRKFPALGNLVIVAGVMNTYSYAYGMVFSGILSSDSLPTTGENGTFHSDNLAVYMQLEKRFWKKLNLLIGGRFEQFWLGDFNDSKPVFRAGLNYQATKSTYIRASVGQGYRFPSIGERYITTTSGNFGFYPNPDLVSENALSSELGVKQMFRIGKFSGLADLAGFYEIYDNYVEFNFGIWGRSNRPQDNMGFKFFNTGPARIYGIDANLMGQGDIFRNVNLSVLLGYTYSMPQCTDTSYVFYKDKQMEYTYVSTSSSTYDNILKYRVQNLLKADVDVTVKKFSAGVSGRYYSYIHNIDKFFYTLEDARLFDIGIKEFRAEHNNGNFIVDLRVSYMVKAFRFSVIVNNVANTEWSLRPATIEPMRLYQVQVVYKV